jgi:hypothetical protein
MFSILGMPGPEGAFREYMLDWQAPLQPDKSLPRQE